MEKIVRTIEIKGILVALDTIEKLNKAFKITSNLLGKELRGSDAFNSLSKSLGVIKTEQDNVTKAQTRLNNELKAAGGAASALDQVNAKVKQLKTTISTIEAKGILGEDIDTTALEGARKELAKIQVQQKANKDAAQTLKNELVASGTQPQGAYRALSAELINARKKVKDLAAAGQTDTLDFKQSLAQVEGLDKRLKSIDASVGQYQRNVGDYASAFGKLGGVIGSIGSLLPGGGQALGFASNITGEIGGISEAFAALGPQGKAIGAIVGGLAAVGSEIINVTREYEEYFAKVNQVTGITGEELKDGAAGVATISEVFDKDFNEVLTSANSLSQNFGISFDESLGLIETGILSGADAQDDLLNKLKEYPVFFESAGFSAEEFLKITAQEVRGGIYDDKLIDSIKEADLSLKEFTKTQADAITGATSQAFSDNLSKRIADGTITTKQAIQEIGQELEKSGADAQDYATITADVFKGAGEDVGGFQRIFEEVNTALGTSYDDLVDKSSAYTVRQLDQLEATKQLNQANADIAAQFAGIGTSFESLTIKSEAFVKKALGGIAEGFRNLRKLSGEKGIFGALTSSLDERRESLQELRDQDNDALAKQRDIEAAQEKLTEEQIKREKEAAKVVKESEDKKTAARVASEKRAKELAAEAKKRGESGSIADLNFQLKELNDQINKTSDVNVLTQLAAQAGALEKKIDLAKDALLRLNNNDLNAISDSLDSGDFDSEITGSGNQQPDDLNTFVGASTDEEENAFQDSIDAKEKQRREQFKTDQDYFDAVDAENEAEQARLDEYNEAKKKKAKETSDEIEGYFADGIGNIFGEDAKQGMITFFDALEKEGGDRLAGIAAGLSGVIGGILSQDIEKQKEALEERIANEENALEESYERRIEAAEGDKALQLGLENELEQEREKIAIKAAEERKKLARREILIQGAVAAIQALANTTLPFPLSLTALIPVAATVGAQLANLGSFAEGGYTGSGRGQRDHTGHRQAGIVHEDEYVVPKRVLVTSEGKSLVSRLEDLRLTKGYKRQSTGYYEQGGFAMMPQRQNISVETSLDAKSVSEITEGVREGAASGSNTGTRSGITKASEQSRLLSQLESDTNI